MGINDTSRRRLQWNIYRNLQIYIDEIALKVKVCNLPQFVPRKWVGNMITRAITWHQIMWWDLGGRNECSLLLQLNKNVYVGIQWVYDWWELCDWGWTNGRHFTDCVLSSTSICRPMNIVEICATWKFRIHLCPLNWYTTARSVLATKTGLFRESLRTVCLVQH